MTGVLLLLVSAGLLLAGAELFADNVAGTAAGLGVSALAVGLLLAGAEPEEMVTGVVAAAGGHPALAAGDAVGANVTMLTLTLGAAAVLRPLPVGRRVRGYAALAALAGTLAALALAGSVTMRDGVALVTAYAGLVALVWWRERRPPVLGEAVERAALPAQGAPAAAAGTATGRPMSRWRALALAAAGLLLMALGGWLGVAGATRLVTLLGRPEGPVGLTVLALATTAELFALVWSARRRGLAEVAVAGVVGSSAYNSTATIGVAALVHPLPGADVRAAAALAALLPLAVLALSAGGRLGRPAGALLVAGYVAYLALVLH